MNGMASAVRVYTSKDDKLYPGGMPRWRWILDPGFTVCTKDPTLYNENLANTLVPWIHNLN